MGFRNARCGKSTQLYYLQMWRGCLADTHSLPDRWGRPAPTPPNHGSAEAARRFSSWPVISRGRARAVLPRPMWCREGPYPDRMQSTQRSCSARPRLLMATIDGWTGAADGPPRPAPPQPEVPRGSNGQPMLLQWWELPSVNHAMIIVTLKLFPIVNPRPTGGGGLFRAPPLVFLRYLLNRCRYHRQTCSTLSPNIFTHFVKILNSRVP